MFSKVAIVCLVLVATFCYVKCCATDESTKTEGINGMAQDNETHLDQEAIMAMCNETFRTSMEYLIELNTTGTFPDETDKTPMCYIRCYMTQIGILNDDELNRDKAIELSWSTSDEALDECVQESNDRTNPCEKAYFMTRCVMMRNIIDTRTVN